MSNVKTTAGGSSADVSLCDLRMAEGSSSRVIQHYRPVGLTTADHVSVSGLDLSKDKQELLVSYESDQIYTFPVFPQVKSGVGPTLDELRELLQAGDDGNGAKVLSELAAYGGHLNRFTFLKVRILDICCQYNILNSPIRLTLPIHLNFKTIRMPDMLDLKMNTFAQVRTLVTLGSTRRPRVLSFRS